MNEVSLRYLSRQGDRWLYYLPELSDWCPRPSHVSHRLVTLQSRGLAYSKQFYAQIPFLVTPKANFRLKRPVLWLFWVYLAQLYWYDPKEPKKGLKRGLKCAISCQPRVPPWLYQKSYGILCGKTFLLDRDPARSSRNRPMTPQTARFDYCWGIVGRHVHFGRSRPRLTSKMG